MAKVKGGGSSKSTKVRRRASGSGGKKLIAKPMRVRVARTALPPRARLPRAAATAKPAPRYLSAPRYGPSSKSGGAAWMRVVIGPAQGAVEHYGSRPAANTPSVMRQLLDDGDLNDFGWIAGHLLNDNLGGPGEAHNLTPLTTAGNKNHLNTCETAIKNFITAAYSRTLLNKADTHWFGVEYSVAVSDEKWDTSHKALRRVATHLVINAKVVRQDKGTDAISDAMSDDCPITCYFDPMTNVRVDNTGYDNLMIV